LRQDVRVIDQDRRQQPIS